MTAVAIIVVLLVVQGLFLAYLQSLSDGPRRGFLADLWRHLKGGVATFGGGDGGSDADSDGGGDGD